LFRVVGVPNMTKSRRRTTMDTSFQAMPSSMHQVGQRLYQMCPPCLRTPVHYVSGPYMGRGEPTCSNFGSSTAPAVRYHVDRNHSFSTHVRMIAGVFRIDLARPALLALYLLLLLAPLLHAQETASPEPAKGPEA